MHTHHPRRVVGILAAIALAVSLLGATTANAAPEPDSFRLDDCSEQYGVFAVPAGEAARFLPENFVPTGIGGPSPEGFASLIVLFVECNGPGENETSSQLWIELVVNPPEPYASDATLHYVHVGGLTDNRTIERTFRDANVPRTCLGHIDLDAPRPAITDTWDSAEPALEPDDLTGRWATDATTRTVDGSGECAGRGWGHTLVPDDDARDLTLITDVAGFHPDPDDFVPNDGATVRIIGVDPARGDEPATATGGIVDVTGDNWWGAHGTATLANTDGLVPFDVVHPGASGHAWTFGATYQPISVSEG